MAASGGPEQIVDSGSVSEDLICRGVTGKIRARTEDYFERKKRQTRGNE